MTHWIKATLLSLIIVTVPSTPMVMLLYNFPGDAITISPSLTAFIATALCVLFVIMTIDVEDELRRKAVK